MCTDLLIVSEITTRGEAVALTIAVAERNEGRSATNARSIFRPVMAKRLRYASDE
jgi:hypothetical protein